MKLVATICLLMLMACSTIPEESDPLVEGCVRKGLFEGVLNSDDLGVTDIRIGRLPDTGRGLGMRIHFWRGLNGPFGQQVAEPKLVVGVGDWQRTCSVVVSATACPNAERAYASLKSLSLPVGHAFDEPLGVIVLHGTQFFLNSRDGEGNDLAWSYYGAGHPAQQAIDSALETLQVCAAPAESAFTRAGL